MSFFFLFILSHTFKIYIFLLPGQPPPSVLWWRSRRIIDDSYELSGRGLTRNEFFIDKLQRKDLMATLTCQASNNNISPPVEASVTLDINCE